MPTTIDAIGVSPTGVTMEQGMNSLKSEDFFRILVTELQQQDPFEPTKTADMVSQVSQIRSIELSSELSDTLSLLSDQQRTSGVSQLLGKFVVAAVQGADGVDMNVSGIVTGLRFTDDGKVILELDTGQTVLASAVTRISSPEALEVMQAAGSADAADAQKGGDAATSKAQDTAKPVGLLSWLGNLLGL
jgi:flagellar basal-body rod modification protein FlgD